jgi:hypothetical protein
MMLFGVPRYEEAAIMLDCETLQLGHLVRLEWSWILIGTSGSGGRDPESAQASWNVSYSKTTT